MVQADEAQMEIEVATEMAWHARYLTYGQNSRRYLVRHVMDVVDL